ncbi:MAG: hypothetical protein LN573_02170 [Rickettsia endosymbiont of Oxypoda opaca]|nr:hypothetical protein [Rickettsia endosymbiont of Oxypoda opaca]
MDTPNVIARRDVVPTWQSRKKITNTTMKIIIFWIATLLAVARNDEYEYIFLDSRFCEKALLRES